MIKLTLRRRYLAVIITALVILVLPSIVLAHANLVRSEPANNAILADPPREVRLWFSEAISPEFSTAQMVNINGQPIMPTRIRVDPTEKELMILTLPELPPGLYSIRWKVLSEADGHFTQGPIVFGVGEGIDMADAVVAEPEIALPWPEVILRWLNFGTLMGLVGAVAVAHLVLVSPGAATQTNLSLITTHRLARRRILNWAKWCAGAGLGVGFGLLLWQVAVLIEALPEGASIWGVSWQIVSRTRWGNLWLVRQAILLLLFGILFWQQRASVMQSSQAEKSQTDKREEKLMSTPLLLLTSLLLLALLVTQALTGHAAAVTPSTTLAIITDALHLLAASLWIGGLMALIIGLLTLFERGKADFAHLVRNSWQPFSWLALLSVGLLTATGLYNTGRQVASIDAMLTTLYGQALLGKMGLMLVMGLFGLLNSMLLHPRLAAPLARLLGRPPGWTPLSLHRLPALLLTEVSLGLLIVLATGLLTASPQARGPEFEVAAEDIPTVLSQTIDDMVVTFSASPNRPGQNLFNIRAASSRRPAPAEVIRTIVRFTFLGEDIGRSSTDAVEIEPGLYQAGGSYLSQAGPWQVQVIVRRGGIEDTVATFNWVVAPPGEARPLIISKRSLEPMLTLAAAIIILITLFVGIGWRLKRGKHTNFFKRQSKVAIFTRTTQPHTSGQPVGHAFQQAQEATQDTLLAATGVSKAVSETAAGVLALSGTNGNGNKNGKVRTPK